MMPKRPVTDRAEHANSIALGMRRAKVNAATLARAIDVSEAQLETWIEDREPIPPVMARKLAAHLHTTAADILFGLSYDPQAPDPVWEGDEPPDGPKVLRIKQK